MTLLMKLEPGVDKVIGVLPYFRECPRPALPAVTRVIESG